MNNKNRKRITLFFTIFTFLVLLLYILCALIPFLEPGPFWFIAILGFVFPILAILVLLLVVGWALARSKWALVCLVIFFINYQQLSVWFAPRLPNSFRDIKNDNALRVLDWNVARWDEPNREKKGGYSYRSLMMDYIETQGADVLCLQEFFEFYGEGLFESNTSRLEKMGYTYHYFFPSSSIWEGKLKFGMAIFSRLPIIDSAGYENYKSEHSEGLAYVDIKAGETRVRVFSLHLESVGLRYNQYNDLVNGEGGRGIWLDRLRSAYKTRTRQVLEARAIISRSPYPVIVCGDVDDIPNSYTYFALKNGKLRDAFLEKGSGMGRSLQYISPTLRIDYIFSDRKLKIDQIKVDHLPYSDHYPLLADIQYQGS